MLTRSHWIETIPAAKGTDVFARILLILWIKHEHTQFCVWLHYKPKITTNITSSTKKNADITSKQQARPNADTNKSTLSLWQTQTKSSDNMGKHKQQQAKTKGTHKQNKGKRKGKTSANKCKRKQTPAKTKASKHKQQR